MPRSPAARKVFAQPGLVDLPVAVLAAVEQDHRQPVTELGAQAAVARCRGGVDVDRRQVEGEFGGELRELRVHPIADRTAGAGQQLNLRAAHCPSVAGGQRSGPVRDVNCAGYGWWLGLPLWLNGR